MTEAPKRIWTEQESYDFPGYSPCWVWHSAEGLEDSDGMSEYILAAEHERLMAEKDAEIERLQSALTGSQP